ncbi:MAG TPA: TorF family putative porin [Steroidobacteraceae bacterium]|nr:TorF family putative porin [Steroidobacteraceae bacterium]
MKQLKVLSAMGLFALAGAAHADVTSTITLTSDYDYRGWSQSAEEPAIQVSIDYAHASGWYLGTWGSNIAGFSDGGINTASTEVDLYTGFKLPLGDAALDLGLVYYTYSGASDLNFAELYGKFSYSIVTAGIYFSPDFGGKYYGDSGDTALYGFADVNIPAGPLTIGLHAGYSTGDGIETAYYSAVYDETDPTLLLAAAEDSYLDYGIGLSYSGSNFTTGIKWVGRDGGDRGSDDRILVTISTTIPWAE